MKNCDFYPNPDNQTTANGDSFREANNKFNRLKASWKKNGHCKAVIVVWLCEFKRKLATKAGRAFLKKLIPFEQCERLNIRNCIYAGHSSTLCLRWRAEEDPTHVLIFLDQNQSYGNAARSFDYPYSCSSRMLQPEISECMSFKNGELVWNDETIVHGFIVARVLAPKGLYDPTVPFRTKDGQVHYLLCHECGIKDFKKECRHEDDKRAFITHVSITFLNHSVRKKSYKIVHVYEIEVYEKGKSAAILKPFYDTLFHFKSIFSAPTDQSEWEDYCNQINNHFKFPDVLKIQPTDLEPSIGKSKIIKKAMNETAGRLLSKPIRTTSEICENFERLNELLCNNNVKDMIGVDEHCVEVLYDKVEKIRQSDQYHLPTGALIYSNAKCHFFDMIEELEGDKLSCHCFEMFNSFFSFSLETIGADVEILYTQTDACIARVPKDADLSCLKIDNLPGHWKHEIKGQIVSFDAVGKNVSFVHS